jgi:hypothetical protein
VIRARSLTRLNRAGFGMTQKLWFLFGFLRPRLDGRGRFLPVNPDIYNESEIAL